MTALVQFESRTVAPAATPMIVFLSVQMSFHCKLKENGSKRLSFFKWHTISKYFEMVKKWDPRNDMKIDSSAGFQNDDSTRAAILE